MFANPTKRFVIFTVASHLALNLLEKSNCLSSLLTLVNLAKRGSSPALVATLGYTPQLWQSGFAIIGLYHCHGSSFTLIG